MKWIRRLAILVAVLVLVIGVGSASVYALSESKLSERYAVKPETSLVVVADSALIARGEHLASSIAKCADCHGNDLGGGIVIDEAPIGHVEATNLTTGSGGVIAKYDNALLERAIRHGIGHDGRNLLIMPSADYNHLSDADVTALIAYIRSREPVNREHAVSSIGPVIRAMWVAGKAIPANAAKINHDAPHLAATPAGNNEAAGQYIAENGCAGCHGATYAGGPIPGAPPGWKPPANLTPSGIGHYSLENFRRILREGKRPDGTAVDTLMPIKATSRMSDEEIESVYKYLKTVPPKAFGLR